MTEPFTSEPPARWQRQLFDRARAIIVKPQSTWDVIDVEATPIRDLLLLYALPLAAIGPVAGFLGGQMFGRGVGVLGTVYRPSFFNAVSAAVIQYVFAIIGVVVLGFIIHAFARQFGGIPSRNQAFKVAIYGSTAAWLAGIFQLVPVLSALGIVGLYSLYLLYVGLPKLMKAPREKAMIYLAVVIIAAVMVWIVAGALGAALTPRLVP